MQAPGMPSNPMPLLVNWDAFQWLLATMCVPKDPVDQEWHWQAFTRDPCQRPCFQYLAKTTFMKPKLRLLAGFRVAEWEMLEPYGVRCEFGGYFTRWL